MSRLLTIRHHAPVHKLKICTTEATVVTTSHATEIFARVAPIASGTSRNQCTRQTQIVYQSATDLLAQHQAYLGNVVSERVFLHNIGADWADFEQVRTESYRRHGITGRLLPALACLGQSPCRPGQDVELLLYAVVPGERGTARVESPVTPGPHTAAKRVQIGSSQHLYLNSLADPPTNGAPQRTIRQQSDSMWTNLTEILENQGGSSAHVLRASAYLGEIDRDYHHFQAAHRDFFERQNRACWPVLFIHGGRLHPPDALCGMEVHALLNPDAADIQLLEHPMPGDTPASVRGVKLALEEHTYLFLHAAAVGVDNKVAAEDAIAPSVKLALCGVRELLGSHGATLDDLAQVLARLKSASLAHPYESLCESFGLSNVPHTVVQAGLCRPELLAELELTAVIATP